MIEVARALSPVQDAWLAVLTGIEDIAPEPQATCGDCVMCAGAEVSGSRARFEPSVKCCSYVPNVPNFLAGRALAAAAETGSGAGGVRARSAGRAGVTPLGLGLTRPDVHRLVGAQSHFGRSADVICPHFETATQSCGIWQNRNAVCATWFCKHERGAVSQRFWHAVRDLLIAAEERLAYRCMVEGGLPEAQVVAVLNHRSVVREAVRRATGGSLGSDGSAVPVRSDLETGDDASPAWSALMWGEWLGREAEWFGRCAELVDAVGPRELTELMDGVRHLAENVTRASNALPVRDRRRVDLPDPVRFVPREVSEVSELSGGTVRLVGYSEFDPLVAPAPVAEALRAFDGRPTAEVLAELGRRQAPPIGPDVLGRLHDFGLLAADPPDPLESLNPVTVVEVTGPTARTGPGHTADPAR